MISAIVLAAGCSKRMNGQNKLTTELKNKHLINHILGTLIKSKINKIIVVLGFQNLKVKKIIVKNKKICFVYNNSYKSGMASSIQAGLKRLSKRNIGFLIVQADMPLISKKIINSLCYSIKNNNKEIVVPIYKKKLGNPIGFKSSMITILSKTKGDSGAKKMIKRNKKKLSLIRVNSKSIFKDFNTQRDFLLN